MDRDERSKPWTADAAVYEITRFFPVGSIAKKVPALPDITLVVLLSIWRATRRQPGYVTRAFLTPLRLPHVHHLAIGATPERVFRAINEVTVGEVAWTSSWIKNWSWEPLGSSGNFPLAVLLCALPVPRSFSPLTSRAIPGQ
jgi:hypothetical protein